MSAITRELEPSFVKPATRAAGLASRYDDPFDPSELTLYDPAGESRLTEWLSADPDVARPLAEMR